MSNFEFGGKRCKTVCPKCADNNLALSETWDGNGIYFTVEDGLMPHSADDHYQGGSTRVDSLCNGCGHRWKLRGVTSIYDIVDEQDD